LRSVESGDTLALLGRLTLTLNDIKMDEATVQSGQRLITDVVSMKARRLMVKLSDSLNKITLKKVVISSDSQSIQLDSLRIIPRYPKFTYSEKNGTQIDRISLRIPRIICYDMDFKTFARSGKFHCGYVEITHARLEDFHSMIPPSGPPSPKSLYNTSLIHLNQKVKFDSIK